MKTSKRCAYWWERKHKGNRYVYARGQCKRMTAHPSGYCGDHKYMRELYWTPTDPARNGRNG